MCTEQVDDAVVVGGEEADEVLEEQHEGHVDDAVVEIVGGAVELQEGVQLLLEGGQRFDEALSVHGSQRAILFSATKRAFYNVEETALETALV